MQKAYVLAEEEKFLTGPCASSRQEYMKEFYLEWNGKGTTRFWIYHNGYTVIINDYIIVAIRV